MTHNMLQKTVNNPKIKNGPNAICASFFFPFIKIPMANNAADKIEFIQKDNKLVKDKNGVIATKYFTSPNPNAPCTFRHKKRATNKIKIITNKNLKFNKDLFCVKINEKRPIHPILKVKVSGSSCNLKSIKKEIVKIDKTIDLIANKTKVSSGLK